MDPNQVARAVRSEIQRLDSDLILEDFRTLKASFGFDGDYMDVEHMELGKDAAAAPVFAFMALLLAAIGLYAVIAHSISQRTREIGVRMAVGATPGNIRGMILRDGLTPVAAGMLLGLAASLAVNRVLQSQLVGVSPYDPLTMGGAPVVLLVVALLACQIPARRAMNVDPVVALRQD
jgi:putative ABC transport system permease protein